MTENIDKNIKVAIIGNGAIGNILAYRCQQLAVNYQVITRAQQPITLEVNQLNKAVCRFSLPITSLSNVTQCNLILVPIKAYQVADFMKQVADFMRPEQTLVLLHNGMGTLEAIQQKYPFIHLVAATTTYGAFKPSTNRVDLKGEGQTHLGWIKAPATNSVSIEKLLCSLLPPSTWHKDIHLALWLKLAVNAAINPLTALYNVKNGTLLENRFQEKIIALCEEVTQIMTRLGFELYQDTLLHSVNNVIQNTAENFSSMNRDIQNKRRTEIDFINGYIATKAQLLGIACPMNGQLLNKIKVVESGYSSAE